MGKRENKRQRDVYPREKTLARKGKSRSGWLMAALIAGALAAGGIYFLVGAGEGENAAARGSRSTVRIVEASTGPYKFRETRDTLSPTLFTGQVADAYRIAKEIPEVLDQLYCYCRCAENFGHKSLLSCYADRHASTCGICMDQAQLALEMHKKGKSPAEIQKEFDKRFG